jgi:hypothetical protein
MRPRIIRAMFVLVLGTYYGGMALLQQAVPWWVNAGVAAFALVAGVYMLATPAKG